MCNNNVGYDQQRDNMGNKIAEKILDKYILAIFAGLIALGCGIYSSHEPVFILGNVLIIGAFGYFVSNKTYWF